MEILSTLGSAPYDRGIVVAGIGLRGDCGGDDGIVGGFSGSGSGCGNQIFPTDAALAID